MRCVGLLGVLVLRKLPELEVLQAKRTVQDFNATLQEASRYYSVASTYH